MTSIIELAVDFLDKVANPAHGRRVNEEYSARLGQVSAGETFHASLRGELRQLRDPASLTPYGWGVVFNWSRLTETRLDHDLLIALCEFWESAAFKAQVIEVAVPGTQSSEGPVAADVRGFPEPWLRELLIRATRPLEYDRERRPGEEVAVRYSRHAESLLMALISVESDVALSAAAALLREDWDGREALLISFWNRVDDLDDETAAVWVDTLSPPERPA